jgi:hypothetical protein
MVLGMLLVLLIASTAAVADLRMEKRRQREDEMIWRGNQYVRAIRLYYHKTGHYPQTLDDLQTGLPDLHFLRSSALKDPLNTTDGAWRFIYVNATGQIIGSVKYASLQQMALIDLNGGQLPGTTSGSGLLGAQPILPFAPASSAPVGGAGSAMGAQPSQGATAPTSPVSPGQTATAPATPSSPDSGSAQTPVSAQPGQTAQSLTQPAQPGVGLFGSPVAQQPTGPVDGPVLGAFLTGVASKVDQPSVKAYNGGTDYNQWEFIWNPVEDQAKAVQQGLGQTIQMPNLLGPAGSTGIGGSAPAGSTNPAPFGGSPIGATGPGTGGTNAPGSTQLSPGSQQAPQ